MAAAEEDVDVDMASCGRNGASQWRPWRLCHGDNFASVEPYHCIYCVRYQPASTCASRRIPPASRVADIAAVTM
eukprot:scaffold245192_cov17-Prasinocladus_malaysianus.AAC.1